MNAKDAIILARPGHWLKNVLVLMPIIFAGRMSDLGAWTQALWATAAFCMASSAIYVLNDLVDRKRDSLHPAKKDRPLASGRISLSAAACEGIVLLAAAGALCIPAQKRAALMALIGCYVALQLAYSLALKKKMILDVICIAVGFVLRAVAGAVAIGVEASPWLVICTFTLCLFMGFCKRYSENAALTRIDQARDHRLTLGQYTPELLTHLITLSASIAVISFLQYATSDRKVAALNSPYLVYTLPLVIYGIFRFAMLSMNGRFVGPMDIIRRDRALQATVLIWMGAVLGIIKWGSDVQSWLARAA